MEQKQIERKKKWLKRYRKNVACLERLKMKLSELDERLYNAKTPNYSGMPRGGQPIGIEELLHDKEKLQNRINNISRKCRQCKDEILDEIDRLDDFRYIDILEQYYIDCKCLREIADSTGYHIRHVARLLGDGIKTLSSL